MKADVHGEKYFLHLFLPHLPVGFPPLVLWCVWINHQHLHKLVHAVQCWDPSSQNLLPVKNVLIG